MAVAALYDIHANLPALKAVLEEVRRARVDRIFVGGDVAPGPMPRETLACLLNLDIPVQFIHGNCELEMLTQMVAMDGGEVTYWDTTSGKPLSDQVRPNFLWAAQQLKFDYESVLASWQKILRLSLSKR